MAQVANIALAHFQSTPEWQNSASAGVTLEIAMEHHKDQLLESGDYRVLLPQCCSQRLAFVARMVHAQGNVEPLLYFYAATRLWQQQEAQQVLLGRVGLPVMAACLLKASLHIREESTYSLRLLASNDEARGCLRRDWPSFTRRLALPQLVRCAWEEMPDNVLAHDESG